MPISSIPELNRIIKNLQEQIKELEDYYLNELKRLDDQYKDMKDKKIDFYKKTISELNFTIDSKNKEIEELNFTVESCLNTINELKKLDAEKPKRKVKKTNKST